MLFYRQLLLFFVALLLLSGSAYAESKRGWATMALAGGGYKFDSLPGMTNEPVYGVKLGYDISGKSLRDRLAIEAVYMRTEGRIDALDADVNVTQLRIDLLYPMKPLRRLKNLTPFLTVGAGGQFIDGDLGESSEPVAAYGLGFKFPFSDSLSLRAEARHILVFADEQKDEFEYTMGLQYTFGKPQKAKPKKAVKVDSDKDGVYDSVDKCPDTPEGMKVKKNGCPDNPPDTDKDGVADYLDKCLGTQEGYPVDANGCLFDTDKDGVADPFDKCPNNPPGFEVNDDGCMKISE